MAPDERSAEIEGNKERCDGDEARDKEVGIGNASGMMSQDFEL